MTTSTTEIPSESTALQTWVQEQARLCQPEAIYWCDGSDEEYQQLCEGMVRDGTLTELNQELRPNCYLARSDFRDVARVEERTFICSQRQDDAGPTNNWREPGEMKRELLPLFAGCMRGRSMYVIPFLLGPAGAKLSRHGVQLTDSPYVAASMHIMARIVPIGQTLPGGTPPSIVNHQSSIVNGFVSCLHSLGAPLEPGVPDVPWPCNDTKYIAHFPETREIWSFGSGYGGNALLSKKCFALRIASKIARDEGWLAEHMLILGITSPEGVKKYFAAAFPSQCGKTNLSMLTPTLPGWKIECVGDDIAWMHFGDDGRLYAINPEAGFFGVAPGTSWKSNPHAMATIAHDTIFTNVAETPVGDVWWEGMTPEPPPQLIDWRDQPWTPASGAKAAHPNSRFTASVAQCPVADPHWDDPRGVPIAAILFGGRRPSTVPLVYESFDWDHGVFLGSIIASATTSAAAGATGLIRHDPFAMLPFCGYHMGDYFAHWLALGKGERKQLPKFYAVNWFRTNVKGEWLWPGYGDNIRVLRWIFDRIEGSADASETPIGCIPTAAQLSLGGDSMDINMMEEALAVDRDEWLREVADIRGYYEKFGDRLPEGLRRELAGLRERLG